jgi:hypothetical protein
MSELLMDVTFRELDMITARIVGLRSVAEQVWSGSPEWDRLHDTIGELESERDELSALAHLLIDVAAAWRAELDEIMYSDHLDWLAGSEPADECVFEQIRGLLSAITTEV